MTFTITSVIVAMNCQEVQKKIGFLPRDAERRNGVLGQALFQDLNLLTGGLYPYESIILQKLFLSSY